MKSMNKHIWILLTLSFLILTGFDYSKHNIPLSEIYSGGPPKDGIPALIDPHFIEAKYADFLNPDDRVLGLVNNLETKAYPIKILNWHEVVNDKINGKSVLITYCPLTGSGIAFDPIINEKRSVFGVSGKIYNSNLLLYDRDTDNLWSQLRMESVTGNHTGKKLTQLHLTDTTWASWKEKHPHTKVLSLQTGHRRDYSKNPYAGYERTERTYFPVSNKDSRLNSKDYVIGVIINGYAKAYPVKILKKLNTPLKDKLGGKDILIHFDKRNNSAFITSKSGEIIPSVKVFWFAWSAFHKETKLLSEK